MTPITAEIAITVVTPEISISHRTLATIRAASGSSGWSSSANGLLMDLTQARSETLVVAAEEAGERLDRVLAARVAELSRSRHKALILAGRVAIDGAPIPDPRPPVNPRGHHPPHPPPVPGRGIKAGENPP